MRTLAVLGSAVVTAGAVAGPAAAGPPERAEDPFVCPVLNVSEQAVANAGRFAELGDSGQYTFLPGKAGTDFNGNVPNHATNGDGAGTPGVDHSGPGDTDYSAIWSGND